MAQGHPTAAAMASYRRSKLPFARPQTLQTLQKSAQLRREKVPQQAQHAPLPHAKATTRPQQWLKGTPRAAAMASYRRSRLPFARPQTLQTLQKSAQLRREKVPQQAQHAPLPHAKATTRPQQWLKGTPRPQQWLKGTPPAAAMAIRASYRRSRLPFARPQTLQTLQRSAQLRKEKVPQQAQHAPLPHAKATTRPQQWLKGTPTRATPAGKSHHKATAMAQGHPPAAAMASYRRSRLPFARPQTLQTLQKSAQLRREKVPQQAQHAPLPHAKATTRPQQWLKGTPRPQQWLKGSPRPQQWLLIGAQGCRLPGLKPSKSPPSSAGKRCPNKPNTRYFRTQKPPQGHSNGWRAPPGRSNGYKGLL